MLQALQAMAASTASMFSGGIPQALLPSGGFRTDLGRAYSDLKGGDFGQAAANAAAAFNVIKGPAGTVAESFKKVYDAGVALANAQLESNRNLRQWNAGVHQSYVNLEIQRIRNQQNLANATQASASALAEAQRRQEQTLSAGEIGAADWKNQIGVFFKDLETGAKSWLYEITGAAAHGRELQRQNRNAKTPADLTMEMIGRLAAGDLKKSRQRNPIELPPRRH